MLLPAQALACCALLFLAGCAATDSVDPGKAGTAASGEKFRLVTADGENELQLGLLLQVLGRLSDDARDPQSDFTLKRARPEISGRLKGGLLFNLEPNFSEDDVELEEAWIGPELFEGRATLHLGRMKAPFNLEEVRSRRYIDFPFFSIVNQFAPAEDTGAFLNGKSASEVWEYGFAVYNGTGGSDTNGSKDVAARLMVHPYAGRSGAALENLQLGLAATAGVQDDSLAEEVIQNETHLDLMPYAADARQDGSRERLGLELAWFRGPWFLQSEYLGVSEELSSTAGDEAVRIHGGYVTLSRTLTGEVKSFRGVQPAEPFDFTHGTGRGAWVLAARYSLLNLDDDLEALVEPGTFTDEVQTGSVGLNWIPNAHSILRMSVVGSFYDRDVQLDTGSGDREAALLVEFQLHY